MLCYIETWHSSTGETDGYEKVIKRCVGFLGIALGDLKASQERTNLLAFLRRRKQFLSSFGLDDITPKVVAGHEWDLDKLVPEYFDDYFPF